MSVIQVEPVTYVSRTPEGTWRVAGSRVSLDSIIDAYARGESAEQIVQAFPTLSLEQVYGALAFYLRHRDICHAYMQEQRCGWTEFQRDTAERNRDLRDRIRERAALQSDRVEG